MESDGQEAPTDGSKKYTMTLCLTAKSMDISLTIALIKEDFVDYMGEDCRQPYVAGCRGWK